MEKKPKYKDYPPTYKMKRMVLEFPVEFSQRVRFEAAARAMTIKDYVTMCILERIAKDVARDKTKK